MSGASTKAGKFVPYEGGGILDRLPTVNMAGERYWPNAEGGDETLVARLRGRAQFNRERGAIKDAELQESAATALSIRRKGELE